MAHTINARASGMAVLIGLAAMIGAGCSSGALMGEDRSRDRGAALLAGDGAAPADPYVPGRQQRPDAGPGVPPDAREHIFRKFFQKDVKRHVGNVGLGLALCEKVVLRHGGIIGIDDAKPKGARFYFTLPAAEMKREFE